MDAALPANPESLEAGRWRDHAGRILALSAPIGLALLAEIGMGLISTLTLGGVGGRALAAGAFGTNVFITLLLVLQGMLSGVGVLAANRVGAGDIGAIPGLYWSGVLLAVLLSVPLFAALSLPAGIWRALGQERVLSEDVAAYLHILRWGVPAGVVGIGMMRQFLPAIGLQRLLIWVLPAGVVFHLALNLVLVRGVHGVGGFGMTGSAAAIVASLTMVALVLLALLHGPKFGHPVAWSRPRAAVLRQLLGIGLPVSATVLVEAGLFLAIGLAAAALGPRILAAHMIALSVASVSFMVPLAISQAANVVVSAAMGAGDAHAARRAGLCAIAISVAFMSSAALALSVVPHLIVGLYLPAIAANSATSALAASLLRVAGVFQLADGTQVAASGALRGLQDVRVPMLLATFGYWGIGFWSGLFLAFQQQMGVLGLWWGLCAGLTVVALCLTARFWQMSRT